jgi:hypothetical protein
MPTKVTKVRIFVASPGDCLVERQQLDKVVDELNIIVPALAPDKQLSLELVKWETSIAPGVGRDAQDDPGSIIPDPVSIIPDPAFLIPDPASIMPDPASLMPYSRRIRLRPARIGLSAARVPWGIGQPFGDVAPPGREGVSVVAISRRSRPSKQRRPER